MAVGSGHRENQQYDSGGMPGVVKPDIAQYSSLSSFFPLMVVSIRVEWPTVWFSEYPSFVVPELTGGYAFGVLCFLVDFQKGDYWVR